MKLFPKARRRKPGIYAYRTRRHLRRGTEWGYAGMSTNLPKRYQCHAGTCAHTNCREKPWYDLKGAYFELRLPWWLGWKWFLLLIETIMIAVLRPRYNTQKNPRRSKVRPRQQQVQRSVRNLRASLPGPVRLGASPLDIIIRATAGLLLLAGPVGYLLTR
jgi:hypothetical protein